MVDAQFVGRLRSASHSGLGAINPEIIWLIIAAFWISLLSNATRSQFCLMWLLLCFSPAWWGLSMLAIVRSLLLVPWIWVIIMLCSLDGHHLFWRHVLQSAMKSRDGWFCFLQFDWSSGLSVSYSLFTVAVFCGLDILAIFLVHGQTWALSRLNWATEGPKIHQLPFRFFWDQLRQTWLLRSFNEWLLSFGIGSDLLKQFLLYLPVLKHFFIQNWIYSQ